MLGLSRFATLVCSLPLIAGAAAGATENASAMLRAKSALTQIPLRFEANVGQQESEVRYTAHSGGYTLLLTAHGPSFLLGGSRIDVSLQHGNPTPEIEPLNRLAGRTDYFVGNRERWRSDVPVFERVRYGSVYPDIDVVYYGNQNQLEYDFVLQPGADPSRIRMKFGRAARLSLNPEGDLVVEAGGARMLQKRPYVYQEDAIEGKSVAIGGGYRLLSGNRVALRLANYDRRRKLVIDPVITYCTYLGGSSLDQINAMKLMPDGRLFLTGQTDTGQIPFVDGAYNNTSAGLTDVFVSIIDTKTMQLVYSTYLGGSNNDVPLAMDVDAQGVIYLTGTTTSSNFPIGGRGFQITSAGSAISAFVAQIDPSVYGADALLFSTYLTGDGDTLGNGIAAGVDGTIYVIGTTKATDFPITSSTAYQPVLWGTQDAFLCRIDTIAGAIVYGTYLGGESQDDGRNILVGANGLVYFAASTLSQNFPLAGFAYAGNPLGGQDIILGILDMSKAGTESLVYSTYFGGSGNEEVRKLAFDGKGNLIFTGYTLSTDFPVSADAIQNVNNGAGDAFVAVLNPMLPFQFGLLYSTYLGGKGGDVGYDVTADSDGSIYLTGYTLSPDFPIAGTVPQGQWGGGTNVFITKFKTGSAGRGALQLSSYIGETGTYVPSGVAVASDGRIFLAGRGNIGLPSSEVALQGGYAGGTSDGFLIVIGQ